MVEQVSAGVGFDLNDFLSQLQQMKNMGGLSSLLDKLPAQMAAKAGQVDMDKAEKEIKRKEGIIQSMTPLERRKPELIKATRKRRIAAGSGVHVQEVNRLLNGYWWILGSDSHGTTLSVFAHESGRQKAQTKAFATGDHDPSSSFRTTAQPSASLKVVP